MPKTDPLYGARKVCFKIRRVKLNREFLQHLIVEPLKFVLERALSHPESATDILFIEEAHNVSAFRDTIPCVDDQPVVVRDDHAFEPPNT